jgi:predicted dehydrogenase
MARTRLTRRQLLAQAVAAAAAPYAIRSAALGRGAVPPASDRITLGMIGTGSHGTSANLGSALGEKACQVVALCDVDGRNLARAARMVPDAAAVRDWRQVVARGDIDAVVVSTPDHWHVPISLAAVRAGKDVMCEKPLTLTIREGRLLADAVARYGHIFQTASEFRAMPAFHRAAELVRNGRIGRLERIRVVLGSAPGGQMPLAPTDPPADLDWDMWLGPAPRRPYVPLGRGGCHYNWRWISDFSGGQFSDWGGHVFDQAQWGHGTEHTGPVRVEGTGEYRTGGVFDTAFRFRVEYEYADGVRMTAVDADPQVGGTGTVRYEGTDGWVSATYANNFRSSSPDLAGVPIGSGKVRLYTEPRREMRNFLDCVRSRHETYYPAETGHRSATIAHLGNLAMRLGRPLRWDPAAEQFIGDDEANRMRSRAMREPWGP